MRALLAVVTIALTVPALAGPPKRNADNHCMGGIEAVTFHCATDKGQWIDVCAEAQSANPIYFQYRFGKKGNIEMSKPEAKGSNLDQWSFERQMLARGESRSASFSVDDWTYEVFVTEAGRDTMAGVNVKKDGEVKQTLTCANQTFDEDLTMIERGVERHEARKP